MEALQQQMMAVQQYQQDHEQRHTSQAKSTQLELGEARRETQQALLQIAEARQRQEAAQAERRQMAELALKLAGRPGGGGGIVEGIEWRQHGQEQDER